MDTCDSEARRVLILGIGNLLWADEGFGVRMVERLAAGWRFGPQVELLDGGTQGLYLVHHIADATHLLVFDAIDYGLAPGTLKLVRNSDVPAFMGAKKMSLHQTGFQDVLAAAQMLGHYPQRLTLIGVQPACLEDFGGSLSPVVEARAAEALQLGLAELAHWGVHAEARATGEAAPALVDAALAQHAYEAGRPSAQRACRLGDERFLPQTLAEIE
ncbi:MAG TPA: HyaD/HybD family hydrogenase maturation endopeptidase [Plasticicumulans sp.]|uniref:HyaD/HybD family hydrogenase maturation endopeptidase n=1 Tax=Plasticicumulans sp. TaxID=2307179 RepID=UPI002CE0E7E4|nr:HyaD/HybD family hydrogenase maturation endopeptidase [Plasticicumulans sp.]HMW27960.1 HyaD/HybD family hydrogenase maturation endopeptidase [Plasticicumulans sp.]HMW27972.1 HyaD/HybD family hydrogenase maturation endopeptidase [Plasticicumulans sp.]HMW42305.1 HyaD/HybD family hydrogenase maturation endopeptidase [Plasticicumulans sp.]HND98250.1 HyaD/HybD family hydrogenase maturation endopeptidase [Plasticicumulans sp.]HNG51353.1 HyaD/HybD family hydrogenase maturation endopeptidase [Plast